MAHGPRHLLDSMADAPDNSRGGLAGASGGMGDAVTGTAGDLRGSVADAPDSFTDPVADASRSPGGRVAHTPSSISDAFANLQHRERWTEGQSKSIKKLYLNWVLDGDVLWGVAEVGECVAVRVGLVGWVLRGRRPQCSTRRQSAGPRAGEQVRAGVCW